MSEQMRQMSDETVIRLIGMHKWYGDFHVLKDINLKLSAASAL